MLLTFLIDLDQLTVFTFGSIKVRDIYLPDFGQSIACVFRNENHFNEVVNSENSHSQISLFFHIG